MNDNRKKGWLMWWMTVGKRLTCVIMDNRKKVDSCDEWQQKKKGWLMWLLTTEKTLSHMMNDNLKKGWIMWSWTTEKGWLMWCMTTEKRLTHVMNDNWKRLNHVITDNRKKADSCDNGHLWDTCQRCWWPYWPTLPTQNAHGRVCMTIKCWLLTKWTINSVKNCCAYFSSFFLPPPSPPPPNPIYSCQQCLCCYFTWAPFKVNHLVVTVKVWL